MRSVRMWVDPVFKRKMKAEAAMRGISLHEYTKIMAKQEEEEIKEEKKLRRPRFGF